LLSAASARIVLLFIRSCQILLQHRHQGLHAVHLQRMLWKLEQFRHLGAVQQFLPLGCMHARRCCLREFVLNFIFKDKFKVNPNTNMPYECNSALSNSCPTNFACTYDQLSGNSVCCGATNMGKITKNQNERSFRPLDVCPEGEKAYVNAVDMSVRECLINVEGSCPSNYLCRFNAQKNRYFHIYP